VLVGEPTSWPTATHRAGDPHDTESSVPPLVEGARNLQGRTRPLVHLPEAKVTESGAKPPFEEGAAAPTATHFVGEVQSTELRIERVAPFGTITLGVQVRARSTSVKANPERWCATSTSPTTTHDAVLAHEIAEGMTRRRRTTLGLFGSGRTTEGCHTPPAS